MLHLMYVKQLKQEAYTLQKTDYQEYAAEEPRTQINGSRTFEASIFTTISSPFYIFLPIKLVNNSKEKGTRKTLSNGPNSGKGNKDKEDGTLNQLKGIHPSEGNADMRPSKLPNSDNPVLTARAEDNLATKKHLFAMETVK